MILLLTLILLTYLFGSKTPTNYLYCGLFGWVGKNPSTFSRHAFTILGIGNDSRGGDSCGVYSNHGVIYGTGYTRDFPTFIKKIGKIKAGKDCVVLGHTRKASIGHTGASNAQPVVLKDENSNLGFVMTHNGTLINHKELAKKYKLSTKNLRTDSHVLAALIYDTEAGPDILAEYNGAAAVVYHLPGTNKIYIFKGKSKSSSNYNTTTEERPLYGYQESPHSFYYSSVKGPLELIAKSEKDIFDIECNTLYEVEAGVLKKIREIDRSKMYQRYVAPVSNVHYPKGGYGSRYAGYNDDDYDYSGTYGGVRHNSVAHGQTKWLSPPEAIGKEALIHLGSTMITLTRGRYHLGENLVHGKVTINDIGLVRNHKETSEKLFTLYFWEGVLLNGEDAFEEIKTIKAKKVHIGITSTDVLDRAPYPACGYINQKEGCSSPLYEVNDAVGTVQTYSGKWCPILCNREYYVKDGLVSRIITKQTIKKVYTDNVKFINTWG
jgi:hypothetical protein